LVVLAGSTTLGRGFGTGGIGLGEGDVVDDDLDDVGGGQLRGDRNVLDLRAHVHRSLSVDHTKNRNETETEI
jgi:hypothetical protein